MSLVNNFVRKIYLHTSHLCFHEISELAINNGLCGNKSNNPKGRNFVYGLGSICAVTPEGPILQELSTAPAMSGAHLPKLQERLHNAPRHRVGLVGCLCRATSGTLVILVGSFSSGHSVTLFSDSINPSYRSTIPSWPSHPALSRASLEQLLAGAPRDREPLGIGSAGTLPAPPSPLLCRGTAGKPSPEHVLCTAAGSAREF